MQLFNIIIPHEGEFVHGSPTLPIFSSWTIECSDVVGDVGEISEVCCCISVIGKLSSKFVVGGASRSSASSNSSKISSK